MPRSSGQDLTRHTEVGLEPQHCPWSKIFGRVFKSMVCRNLWSLKKGRVHFQAAHSHSPNVQLSTTNWCSQAWHTIQTHWKPSAKCSNEQWWINYHTSASVSTRTASSLVSGLTKLSEAEPPLALGSGQPPSPTWSSPLLRLQDWLQIFSLGGHWQDIPQAPYSLHHQLLPHQWQLRRTPESDICELESQI